MFKFLKEKIQSAVESISSKVEETAQEVSLDELTLQEKETLKQEKNSAQELLDSVDDLDDLDIVDTDTDTVVDTDNIKNIDDSVGVDLVGVDDFDAQESNNLNSLENNKLINSDNSDNSDSERLEHPQLENNSVDSEEHLKKSNELISENISEENKQEKKGFLKRLFSSSKKDSPDEVSQEEVSQDEVVQDQVLQDEVSQDEHLKHTDSFDHDSNFSINVDVKTPIDKKEPLDLHEKNIAITKEKDYLDEEVVNTKSEKKTLDADIKKVDDFGVIDKEETLTINPQISKTQEITKNNSKETSTTKEYKNESFDKLVQPVSDTLELLDAELSLQKESKKIAREDLFIDAKDSTKKKKGFFGRLKEKIVKFQLTQENFEELFWDFELALLENNVAIEVIDKIKNDLQEELTKEQVSRKDISNIILQTLHSSLKDILDVETFNLLEKIKTKKPYIICIVGVNGSGKTTTLAKLIHLLQKNNLSLVVAAADTFRAAAIQQLEEHTNKLGAKLIKHDYNADPSAVAFDAIKHAEAKNLDVVLIDTAGRLQSNSNLMDELKKLVRVNKPDLTIFIGESITGNDCVEQAVAFNELIGIDAIILSKADIDEKGGAAISVSYVTKKPIIYLGMGQTYDDLVPFDKEKILSELGL